MSNWRVALAGLVVLTLLAACGSTGVTARAASGSFPLTMQMTTGTVTIPHRPSRIVSLSPSATQDLFAVGAGKQVVAVDSYSTYPPQAPHTSLSAFTPNIEAIAGYRPDLVVIATDSDNIVTQLGNLEIPVLVEPAAADLNGAYAEIRQIARATGHLAQAAAVVTRMQRQVRLILKSVPPSSRPLRVYHELDQTYFSATSRTFVGQLYKLLGLRNIADQVPASTNYPQLSAEYIISADPDIIVLADTACCGQSLATVKARPGWGAIAAVRTGAVVPVDDSIASQWGPRVVLFLQAIVAGLRNLEKAAA
ncbi:MAG: ABC transporter substrate-binding protein [Candidatus Dormibacteraceae bacterium]